MGKNEDEGVGIDSDSFIIKSKVNWKKRFGKIKSTIN